MRSENKIVVIDIEAENTSYKVELHSKRIISVQLYDGSNVEFFYADSPTNNLMTAKERIRSLIDEGFCFVGYNLVIFDLILLKQFLGLVIPPSQIIEITEMEPMISLMKRLQVNGISLANACNHFGVRCEHKKLLDPITQKIQQDPEIIKKTNSRQLIRLAKKKGWTLQSCQDRALKLTSRGTAILQSYNEFVKSNGSEESIFYKYAVGDVLTEYELYYKIKSQSQK